MMISNFDKIWQCYSTMNKTCTCRLHWGVLTHQCSLPKGVLKNLFPLKLMDIGYTGRESGLTGVGYIGESPLVSSDSPVYATSVSPGYLK